MRIRAASKFIALFPSASCRQMLAIFSENEFLKIVTKLRKRKWELLSCPHVLHQTSIWALSRGIRAKGSLSDDDGNENGKKE